MKERIYAKIGDIVKTRQGIIEVVQNIKGGYYWLLVEGDDVPYIYTCDALAITQIIK